MLALWLLSGVGLGAGLVDARPGADPVQFPIGAHVVRLQDADGHGGLWIERDGRAVWSVAPRKAWLRAGHNRSEFHEHRGMVSADLDADERCAGTQTLHSAVLDGERLVLTGTLDCHGPTATWRAELSTVDEDTVRMVITTDQHDLDHLTLRVAAEPGEAFLGFGEQFSRLNMRGAVLPIWVSEQGIGRGAQPITFGANLVAGAGGHWWTSYAAVPHTITSTGRSFALETHGPSVFDLRGRRSVEVTAHDSVLAVRIYSADSPLGQVAAHTEWAGRMPPLPEWMDDGAIIGMQGGTAAVRETWAQLEAAGTPVAAFWLQDWVGQRTTSFGKQLWWSWTLDHERYPGWDSLVADLDAEGIAVMSYLNPFLVDVTSRGPDYRDLYGEARDQGILVTQRGAPLASLNTDFSAGLLDLVQPAGRAWTVDLIREEVVGAGVKGWMADFGEAFPFEGEVVHSDGVRRAVSLQQHNAYPEVWASVNAEAVAGLAEVPGGPAPEDVVFFMRSGYTRSPGSARLFWLGDQLVSWDRHDGIKTAVTGLLSSGMSGFALNHSDVGGYTTITSPLGKYHRSAELFWRWTELNTFTAVLRTHEGNQPGQNHQLTSDPDTLAHFTRMARIHVCLAPYRRVLMDEAAATGAPLVRHPWLQYSQESAYLDLVSEQFLLGADVMVAPVLDSGAASVSVRLPAGTGTWTHLLTGQTLAEGVHEIDAPVGVPAAFVRDASEHAEEMKRCVAAIGAP